MLIVAGGGVGGGGGGANIAQPLSASAANSGAHRNHVERR